MKEKIVRWREAVTEQALLAKALLLEFGKRQDEVPTEVEEAANRQAVNGELADNQPGIKQLWLDLSKNTQSFRVRIFTAILEASLVRRFRETGASADCQELMDADEGGGVHTDNVETLWAQVRKKVKPDQVIEECSDSGGLREWLKRQPEVLKAAREYALEHLRFLFAKRLNGEPDEETEEDQAD